MNLLDVASEGSFSISAGKINQKTSGENVQHTFLVGVVDSLLVYVMRVEVNVTSLLWYFALKSSFCGFKSLFWDSCASLDSCPVGRIAVEIILDL
jgi:hypothetical protein